MNANSRVRETILIVEDEPSVLSLMVRVMKMEGYHVVAARNGREAFDCVRDTVFDFIMCDIKMPDFNVEAFYGEIQKTYPQLTRHIAFVTGDSVSPQTVDFLNKTGAPYLLKPFSLFDLKKLVADLHERGEREE